MKSWETLYQTYPELFGDVKVECDLGWYEIVAALCKNIKWYEQNIAWHTEFEQKIRPEYVSNYCALEFTQIKEKFGGLRVYYMGSDEYVQGLIDMATKWSYTVCQNCGERGRANDNGWISVLCDKCRDNENN